MEKPPLEKVIERLEKLDVREWERDGNSFNARIKGIIIHIHVYKDMGMTYGHIDLISENDKNTEFCYEPKNKTEKNMIKSFHKRISEKYEEVKDKDFEDRVNLLLSE